METVWRKMILALALVPALLALPAAPAAASPIEVFGFGSRHAGRAGAVAATVDDFAAGYYNPAGLAFGEGKQLAFGSLGAVSNLHVENERIAISQPVGFQFGLRLPAPLGGPLAHRITFGLGMHLLPRTMVQVIARFPDEPFFPYYDNRTQRVVILPAVGVRISDQLAVGVAINFLATLAGRVTAAEGATRGLEARIDEKIPSVARFNVGVVFRPGGALRLAAVVRQKFDIPFSTVAETEVAGEPIDLDISASGVFTPTQVVLGSALVTPSGDASVGLDLIWGNWSAYRGPYVTVRSALPLVGPLASELPAVPYSDTFGARLGGELNLDLGRRRGDGARGALALRAGYAFETSPFPAVQSGVTNLADGPKHTVSVGSGLFFPRAFGKANLRIDAHLQAQLVGERRLEKRLVGDDEPYDPFTSLRDEVEDDAGDPSTAGVQISNPGYPGLRSGGQVFSGGVTAEVEF